MINKRKKENERKRERERWREKEREIGEKNIDTVLISESVLKQYLHHITIRTKMVFD
jgi:hypothetical protein